MRVSSWPHHAASRLYHVATAVPRRTLVLLLVVSLAACSAPLTDSGAGVQVRVRNDTPWSLLDLSLTWPGGGLRVAQLAVGASSDYERHDGAYSYGLLLVTANGAVRRLQPIDYVGESSLPAGRYTYVIAAAAWMPDGIDLHIEQIP